MVLVQVGAVVFRSRFPSLLTADKKRTFLPFLRLTNQQGLVTLKVAPCHVADYQLITRSCLERIKRFSY